MFQVSEDLLKCKMNCDRLLLKDLIVGEPCTFPEGKLRFSGGLLSVADPGFINPGGGGCQGAV